MLRVLCSPTPAAFRNTRGLSDYLEFNHIIEHWLFCLSVNMWSERFLVALPTSGDLFISAKDLFIAAIDGKRPRPLKAGASWQNGSK
jgi:hypothetical protein